ncbi:MAG: SemiSWEET family transporter [Candidatus Altiarchaeota archaeon]
MTDTLTQIIGYSAALVGTSLMLPQVAKTLKTKRVEDVSMGMVVLYLLNCFLWLAYGVLIRAYPLMVCNLIAFFIGLAQMLLKLKYSNR